MGKIGPHVIRPTTDALAWARVAGVVKALDDPAPLKVAPPNALRVFRAYFADAEQRMDADPARVAAAILGRLGGYRHPRLYVETFNETQAPVADLVAFHQRLVPLLHAAGVRVAGPSWATGDYEAEAWEGFRALGWCGLDLIAVHAYWSTAGFTEWNALRWRQFWRPGDPPVIITECGRDKVRDGPNGTYLPHDGDGAFGWQAQGLDADAFLAELAAYDLEIARDGYVLGATPFTCGPTDDWKARGFDLDPLVARLVAASEPRSTPPVTTSAASRPTTQPEPTTMQEWYPLAARRPIGVNYEAGRGGQQIKAIVDHIADGTGSLFGWFNSPAAEVSAHFWVSRTGQIEQYRPLSDTCWANGPINKPDPAASLVRWCQTNGVNPNRVTVALEFEGKPRDILTPIQVAAGRRLHVWLRDTLGIPLDRQHVLGHRDFDSVTRANCPGPNFPWSEMMDRPTAQPTLNIAAERDALWAKADQLEKAGYPWLAQGIKSLVALSKNEK